MILVLDIQILVWDFLFKLIRMKKFVFLAICLVSLGLTSCYTPKVVRVNPYDTYDVSGRWNNADSHLTSQYMIDQIFSDGFIDRFKSRYGRNPVIVVGFVLNKSMEHIDAETFNNDLEITLLASGKVNIVQSGKFREELRAEKADQQTNASQSTMKKFGLEHGADFILQGTISSIEDGYKRTRVVEYQVNLQLTNIQTNEIVWMGNKKIAKKIS